MHSQMSLTPMLNCALWTTMYLNILQISFQLAVNAKYMVFVRTQSTTGVQRLQGPISCGADVTCSLSAEHGIDRKQPFSAQEIRG